ncbi:MAG: DUF4363 family protein [Acetivibrionales bacterium]|mgnify:CR=1 FL=1|jgi:hypothetical protein|nr:DUF4363 family protein [Clostridiaceae bacterium]HOA54074.1 DUF4363 family protein [Clostridiales bacterium]HPZ05936.1 DUF4363 family protein [Clostridiales bacterium]HQD30190.1 DUF4363 family protein [Clostridiales bacterium]
MKYGVTFRVIGAITVLTALIIISGLFTLRILQKDSEKLTAGIESIRNDIRSGKWDHASETLHDISKDWDSTKKTWSTLIDHEEIDNIDMTLARLKAFLEAEDTSSALSEATMLIKSITHIPEREKLSLDNLF